MQYWLEELIICNIYLTKVEEVKYKLVGFMGNTLLAYEPSYSPHPNISNITMVTLFS